MTTPDRSDRQMTDLLGDLADPRYPDYFDDALERAMRGPQRRAWTFPERWIPMGVLARRPAIAPALPWRPIFLLAILVAAAIAVAALAGSIPRVPPPFGLAGNGAVAFAADGDIYLRDAAAVIARPIVGGAAVDVAPIFSRDGTKLAFFRLEQDQEALATLFVSGTDGSEPRPLFGPDVVHAMSWSPSGKEIALVIGASTRSLMLVSVDTGAATLVDSGEVAVRANVEWLPPAGAELVFEGLDQGQSAIYGLRADGSGLRRITAPGSLDTYGGPYGVSADGRYLTYTTVDTSVQLHEVDLQTGADRPFAPNLPAPDEPGIGAFHSGSGVFSPDGKTLMFSRYWDEHDGQINGQVWAANAGGDGSDAVPVGPLHRSRGGHAPFWYTFSPDGTTLLIQMNEVAETWLADPAGTNLEQVDFGLDLVSDPPDWQRTLK